MQKSERSVTVYSTERGRICPGCGKPVAACVCRQAKPRPVGDGIVRVGKESKGRKGKDVTVVSGLTLDDESLKALLGELKKKCGSGGTIKDYVIEIQGDHRDTIVAYLKDKKFQVKKVGG